jgi:acyl-CoA synthetase (NDP forming)
LDGSDAVLDAILKKVGVIRLNTVDEMVEAAELFIASRYR